MHDWALLIFTICVQAAIGGMLLLAVSYRKVNHSGSEATFSIMKWPLIVIAVLSLIGLGASFSHLGTPTNALNTIRHIGSSWMSREILVTGAFIGAACITAGLAILQKKVNPILLVGSVVIGLVDVYCMAAIYATSLVSGWNSINTFTSFYATPLILGAVLAASCMVPALRGSNMDELAKSIMKLSFLSALIGIGIQIIGVALLPSALSDVNMMAATTASTKLEGYQSTIAIRWIIEAIGLALLGFLALSPSKKTSISLAFTALIVIGFAEGLSRYVFYVLG